MKKYIWAVICFIVCHVLPAKAQYAGSYPMPDGSGTLRLGITGNGQDRWLKTNDTLMKESLIIRHILLKDTQGFILKVTNHSLPDSIRLVWALGGFDSPTPSTDIAPETCRDNIFNIEGHQITVYHGKIMHLRVTQALVPPHIEVRLCDGNQQETPMTLFTSGKKTDAPVFCGTSYIPQGETVYFCLYKPNRQADYAYYMLPELVQSLKHRP